MKSNLTLLRIILCLCILAVMLTIKLPILRMDIGTLFLPGYKGMYSLVLFLIFFVIFTALSKKVEDVVLNRMKFVLSITFVLSLLTNALFS